MRTLILAVLLTAPAWAQTHLEYVPPLLHDTSANPAEEPNNPRVHGGEILWWQGTPYLLYADQLELTSRELRSDGSIGNASRSRFRVPPYGDRNLNLFNFAVCDDCRWGAAGFDVQGLVLWDLGTGTSPLFGDSRRWIDSGSIGAFTWKYGTKQYLIARVHAACQGNALVEVAGIQPNDQRLIQCVTTAGGTPQPVDAGFWLPNLNPQPGDPITGWVWLLDSGYRRVHAYTVQTVGGDPWLTAVGWTINAGWILDHGIDIDVEHMIAVVAFQTGLTIWDCSDPLAPYIIHQRSLPFNVPANSVEIRWPYVYVGTMHTASDGSGHLFDISDPYAPVELDQDFWNAAQPWNAFPFSANQGGTWHDNTLFLTRYSVAQRLVLIVEQPIQLIFADGFESGDTGAWVEVSDE